MAIKPELEKTNTNQNNTNQNHSPKEDTIQKIKYEQYLTRIEGKAVNQGFSIQQRTKYSCEADRGRQRLYTHGGGEHR